MFLLYLPLNTWGFWCLQDGECAKVLLKQIYTNISDENLPCDFLTITYLLQLINLISCQSLFEQVSLSFYGKHFRLANILGCFVRLLLGKPQHYVLPALLENSSDTVHHSTDRSGNNILFHWTHLFHWIGSGHSNPRTLDSPFPYEITSSFLPVWTTTRPLVLAFCFAKSPSNWKAILLEQPFRLWLYFERRNVLDRSPQALFCIRISYKNLDGSGCICPNLQNLFYAFYQ